MSFLKEHLAGNHYHWLIATANAAFTGSPGRRIFDPFNGLQVLYIINYFGKPSANCLLMKDATWKS
ncbi:hypothetical protein [Paraflavitalea speifideaquila]|uniref:hypothetical protein n=1 Tax=Paraflavitalea speifideaquila TaxID=3076558 RepID=UPI0028ED6A63|nr:hypothetical protein [Paraflavitalea speifideiaquila]